MGLVKIFTKAKCLKCPAAKEIGTELKKEGVSVHQYDLDTIDGLAEASFYSIPSTPSILIEDENEMVVMRWAGIVPSLQEVKQYLSWNSSDSNRDIFPEVKKDVVSTN